MTAIKTSVTLDPALLQEARAYRVNITAACRTGLEAAVKEARQVAWRAENAAAIAAFNRDIEEFGLPLSEYRAF